MTERILPVKKFLDGLTGKDALQETAVRRMHSIMAGAFPWVNQEHEWKGWLEESWVIHDGKKLGGPFKLSQLSMRAQLDHSGLLTVRFGARNIWLVLGRAGFPTDRPIADTQVDCSDDVGMMASVGFVKKHWTDWFRTAEKKFTQERVERTLLFMSDQGLVEIPVRAHVVISPTRRAIFVTDKKRLPQRRTATGHVMEIVPAGWLQFQRPADIDGKTSRLGTFDTPPEM